MRSTRHNADTATHDNAMPPAHNWLGVGVDQIIQLVLFRKEGLSGAGTTATFGLSHTPVERDNIAASTKCFIALRFDPDCANAIVLSPAFELWLQHPNHLKGECVQRFG